MGVLATGEEIVFDRIQKVPARCSTVVHAHRTAMLRSGFVRLI